MQKVQVFWRDIPAQILVKSGRQRGKAILSQRFQIAIDRAAMRAGKGSSEDYLNDWRRESSSLEAEGSPQLIAEQLAVQIEQQYTDEDINRLVKNKGLDPEYVDS